MTAVAVAAAVVLAAGGITLALLGQDDDRTPTAAAPDTGTGTAPVAEPPTSPPTAQSASATPRNAAAPTTPSKPVDRTPEQESSPTTDQNPATLDLRSATCAAELAPGADGDCVESLQLLLGGHGLYVTVDGRFGQETLAAVRAFQTEAGVAVDGRVGAQTKEALYATARGQVRTGSLTVVENNGALVARCLDARDSPTVGVWTCRGTSTQKWALYRVPGPAATYLVVNQGTHRCLDADAGTSSANGQKIGARACDGLSAQHWRLGDAGENDGQTLVSIPNGYCLDAEAATSGQEGRAVQGWSCAANSNQAWSWS